MLTGGTEGLSSKPRVSLPPSDAVLTDGTGGQSSKPRVCVFFYSFLFFIIFIVLYSQAFKNHHLMLC